MGFRFAFYEQSGKGRATPFDYQAVFFVKPFLLCVMGFSGGKKCSSGSH